ADISGTDDDALLDDLVARASSAIENYCDRKFNYDTYRERYDGDGTTELVIKQYPIGQVTMLSVGTTDVIQFTNVNADAWNAYISVSSTTMTLVIQGGANDGSDSLTLADYTITTLVAAINALGKGWSASVQLSDYGVWDASELMPCSAKECLDSYAYLDCPNEPASEYKVYSDVGTIYLPTGFSSGVQNIIVRYTAGFSTMPDDLVQITLDLVNVYYKSRKTDSTVKAERLGDHAITYAAEGGGGARDIPAHIAKRLAPYKRWSRLGVA
ncbi:MAG: head-tail connector protein, partial [Planctomycetota bacterium]